MFYRIRAFVIIRMFGKMHYTCWTCKHHVVAVILDQRCAARSDRPWRVKRIVMLPVCMNTVNMLYWNAFRMIFGLIISNILLQFIKYTYKHIHSKQIKRDSGCIVRMSHMHRYECTFTKLYVMHMNKHTHAYKPKVQLRSYLNNAHRYDSLWW